MKARASTGGFSLIELLVVMAIMGILIGIAIPAGSSIMRGTQLTQGAQMVIEQLSLARQTALSKNEPVEVRFYQYANPVFPGEEASSPGSGKYRAMQSFAIQSTGAALQITRLQALPETIIMDSGATLSSIIGSAQLSSSSGPSAQSGATLNNSIPGMGMQYNAVTLRFMPDGSTNLSPSAQSTPWFITLHAINNGDKLGTAPSNFYTVQIDAVNGQTRTFRP